MMSSALQSALDYYWKLLQQTLHVSIPASAALAGAEFLGTVIIGKPIAEGILEHAGGKNFRALSPQAQSGYKAIVVGLATVANTASAFAGGYAPLVVPIITVVGVPGAIGMWIGRGRKRRARAQLPAKKTTGITLDDLQRAARARSTERPVPTPAPAVEETATQDKTAQTGTKTEKHDIKKQKKGTNGKMPHIRIPHISIGFGKTADRKDKDEKEKHSWKAKEESASAERTKEKVEAELEEALSRSTKKVRKEGAEEAIWMERKQKESENGAVPPENRQEQKTTKEERYKSDGAFPQKKKGGKKGGNIISKILGGLFRGKTAHEGEKRGAAPLVKIEEVDTHPRRSFVEAVGKRVAPAIKVEEVELPTEIPESEKEAAAKEVGQPEKPQHMAEEPRETQKSEKMEEIVKIVAEESQEAKKFRELVKYLQEQYIEAKQRKKSVVGRIIGGTEPKTTKRGPTEQGEIPVSARTDSATPAVEVKKATTIPESEQQQTAEQTPSPVDQIIAEVVKKKTAQAKWEKPEPKKPTVENAAEQTSAPSESSTEMVKGKRTTQAQKPKPVEVPKELKPLIQRIREEVKRILVEERKKQMEHITWRDVRRIRKEAEKEVQKLTPRITEVAASYGNPRATKEQIHQLALRVLEGAKEEKPAEKRTKQAVEETGSKAEQTPVVKEEKKAEDEDLMSLLGGSEEEDVGKDDDIMSLLGGDEGGQDEDLEDLLGGL